MLKPCHCGKTQHHLLCVVFRGSGDIGAEEMPAPLGVLLIGERLSLVLPKREAKFGTVLMRDWT